MTTIELAEEDAQFLTERIKGLPCGERGSQPVTLDLNGEVIVRGRAEDESPTELLLSNSNAQGPNLRLNTNRQFLLRAAQLGFRRIHFTDSESPAFCQDAHKTFVWAVLEKDGVIPPAANASRLESPRTQPTPTKPSAKEDKKPATPRNYKPNKPPDRNGHTSEEPSEAGGLETLMAQAESLQEMLREAHGKLRGLMTLLKQHRKESKSVQSVLASLRQLPSLYV